MRGTERNLKKYEGSIHYEERRGFVDDEQLSKEKMGMNTRKKAKVS